MNTPMSPESNLRWGIAGAGRISRSIVPDLKMLPGIEVASVFSRDATNAEEFAREFSIPVATHDYGALIDDPSIDIVYLATPIASHADMTRRALLAGKHVLVEKPLATSAAEVEGLFGLADELGLFLMEAMWMKFNPAFRDLFEMLRSGRIGAPTSMRAGFGFPLPDDGGSRWDVRRSGATLLDQGIYPVALAQAIFGEPHTVRATGRLRDDGLDLAEHFTLEFDDGRFVQAACSMTEFVDPSASISGTMGWIRIPGMFWTSTTLLLHAGSWEAMFGAAEQVEHVREGNGYVPMLREVDVAIRAGRTQHPDHSGPDTVAVFRTLDAIRAELEAPLR